MQCSFRSITTSLWYLSMESVTLATPFFFFLPGFRILFWRRLQRCTEYIPHTYCSIALPLLRVTVLTLYSLGLECTEYARELSSTSFIVALRGKYGVMILPEAEQENTEYSVQVTIYEVAYRRFTTEMLLMPLLLQAVTFFFFFFVPHSAHFSHINLQISTPQPNHGAGNDICDINRCRGNDLLQPQPEKVCTKFYGVIWS